MKYVLRRIERVESTTGDIQGAIDDLTEQAGEIKGLAGESQDQAERIEELIDAMQAQTETTATRLTGTTEELTDGIDSVEEAMASLKQITEAVHTAGCNYFTRRDPTDGSWDTLYRDSRLDSVRNYSRQYQETVAGAEEVSQVEEVRHSVELLA